VIDLNNPKTSFILISSEFLDDMMSILWAKNFEIVPIKGYYKGEYEDSALAFAKVDNDELRKEILFLLNHFHQDCGFIKYFGETDVTKVFSDGSEKPMGITLYNSDEENISYLYNGVSFSFVEKVRYWKPTKMEDFKVDMLVEYLNNNKWCQKKVDDPTKDWDNMFKLLTKYGRVRVVSTY
jgi:hypothetical protein